MCSLSTITVTCAPGWSVLLPRVAVTLLGSSATFEWRLALLWDIAALFGS